MSELPYNWPSMSDTALEAQIGKYIRHHRLSQNLSQDHVAKAAGISRSTLSLLERGQAGTINTLIRVLRVLDRLDVMAAFVVHVVVSPLLLAEQQHNMRRRARGKPTEDPDSADW